MQPLREEHEWSIALELVDEKREYAQNDPADEALAHEQGDEVGQDHEHRRDNDDEHHALGGDAPPDDGVHAKQDRERASGVEGPVDGEHGADEPDEECQGQAAEVHEQETSVDDRAELVVGVKLLAVRQLHVLELADARQPCSVDLGRRARRINERLSLDHRPRHGAVRVTWSFEVFGGHGWLLRCRATKARVRW